MQIYRGATFNLAHSLDQMLHLRPRNRFEDLEGVYLVGGGTHPGSGLPVIFESARITSRLMADQIWAVAELGARDPDGAPDNPPWSRSAYHERPGRRAGNGGRIGVIGGGLGGLAAACTLAARGHKVVLFEANAWARRQGRRAGGRRLPLRHGADDPDGAARPAPHLRGGRARHGPGTGPRPARSAMALLLRGRLRPRPGRERRDDGGRPRPLRSRHVVGRAATRTSSPARKRLHEVSDRFFFWKSVEDIWDTLDFKKNMSASTLSDVMSLRMGTTVAGTVRKHVPDARIAQMLDHFVQYVGSSPYGSPAVLCVDRPYADGRRRLVPDGRHPRGAGGAGKAGRAASASSSALNTERPPHRHPAGQGRRRGDRVGETVELDAVVSNMDAVRTYRELLGGDIGAKFERRRKPRAGLLGRRALSRPRPRLRASGAPRLRLLARRGGGVRLDLPQGRAGARSDLLYRGAGPDRTRRRAARRRGALRPGPHALPAPAPRLEPDAAGIPPRHPRQAGADRRHEGPGKPHQGRALADAAGHPRPLPRAERRDLRACQPRPLLRRLQARQPEPRSRPASISPAAPPIRDRECRWS